MKAIILAFLLQLEAIGAAHPGFFDMQVLAAVHRPVHAALVEGQANVVVPEHYGLGSEGDRALHEAVSQFIRNAHASDDFVKADSLDARLDMLFGDAVLTPAGHAFDDYFAFAEMN